MLEPAEVTGVILVMQYQDLAHIGHAPLSPKPTPQPKTMFRKHLNRRDAARTTCGSALPCPAFPIPSAKLLSSGDKEAEKGPKE